jgi:hypothetical protein
LGKSTVYSLRQHVKICKKFNNETNYFFVFSHMGISVTEPGRNHIVKVVDALKASLGEQGYIAK